MMSEHADNLKSTIANSYGVSEGLRDAFHRWVDHVEERMGVVGSRYHEELVGRVIALEKAVGDLHAALSASPAPSAVQKAVADVELPAAPSADDLNRAELAATAERHE